MKKAIFEILSSFGDILAFLGCIAALDFILIALKMHFIIGIILNYTAFIYFLVFLYNQLDFKPKIKIIFIACIFPFLGIFILLSSFLSFISKGV